MSGLIANMKNFAAGISTFVSIIRGTYSKSEIVQVQIFNLFWLIDSPKNL